MAKRKPSRGWNPKRWHDRCAWCARRIKEDEEAFGISVSLHAAAFEEFSPGTIQPLLLGLSGKTVPMLIVTEDSPAKLDGKDAMFQICSETCARALQQALQQELSQAG